MKYESMKSAHTQVKQKQVVQIKKKSGPRIQKMNTKFSTKKNW